MDNSINTLPPPYYAPQLTFTPPNPLSLLLIQDGLGLLPPLADTSARGMELDGSKDMKMFFQKLAMDAYN